VASWAISGNAVAPVAVTGQPAFIASISGKSNLSRIDTLTARIFLPLYYTF
jgi:hypothetical protein